MSHGRPRDPLVDDRIDQATRDLLREGGLSAVTITAVAQRAGVGRPTVYRRHADGADLVRTVLLHDLERLQEGLPPIEKGRGSVLDQMIEQVRPFLEYYYGEPEISRILLAQSLFGGRALSERFTGINTKYVVRLAQVLEAGKATGEIAPDADVVVGAGAFFALYLSTVIGGLANPFMDLAAQEFVLRRTFGQHLDGMRPR